MHANEKFLAKFKQKFDTIECQTDWDFTILPIFEMAVQTLNETSKGYTKNRKKRKKGDSKLSSKLNYDNDEKFDPHQADGSHDDDSDSSVEIYHYKKTDISIQMMKKTLGVDIDHEDGKQKNDEKSDYSYID